jgi:hypothetical protein
VTSVGPGHVVRVRNWNKTKLGPRLGQAGAGPRLGQAGARLRLGQTSTVIDGARCWEV